MLGHFIDHPSEDSLTASVFSHLLHLPSDLFWPILRQACGESSLPESAGEPTVSYWPKWSAAGTKNARYVEPDVFLRFPSFDLIVEAKRWDGDMQKPWQWQNELDAYASEFGAEKRAVRILAVGATRVSPAPLITSLDRIHSLPTDAPRLIECPVHLCSWSAILAGYQGLQRRLTQSKQTDIQTAAHLRVVADVLSLFGVHGFSVGRWFDDFDFRPLGPAAAQPLPPTVLFRQLANSR